MRHDFPYLVDTVMHDDGLRGCARSSRRNCCHELLFMMERGGFLDDLVFQGGTSLGLCHGALRATGTGTSLQISAGNVCCG